MQKSKNNMTRWVLGLCILLCTTSASAQLIETMAAGAVGAAASSAGVSGYKSGMAMNTANTVLDYASKASVLSMGMAKNINCYELMSQNYSVLNGVKCTVNNGVLTFEGLESTVIDHVVSKAPRNSIKQGNKLTIDFTK